MQRVRIKATYEHPALCLDARFGSFVRWIRESGAWWMVVAQGCGVKLRQCASACLEQGSRQERTRTNEAVPLLPA